MVDDGAGSISGMNVGMAILGGILIAVSTSLNLLLKGRITGMSGIFYSLITLDKSSFFWKSSIVAGMLFSGSIMYLIAGDEPIYSTVVVPKGLYVRQNTYLFESAYFQISSLNFGGFAIAGLLVGLGTKMGNGCTSGHGVCGMPRFSLRSWVAVGTFMCAGFGIANLFYYQKWWQSTQAVDVVVGTDFTANSTVILILSVLYLASSLFFKKEDRQDSLISFVVGLIFALGLGFGGMLQRSKILNFLTFSEYWDPQLLILFVTAVLTNVFTFHYIIKKRQRPLFSEKLQIPVPKPVDLQLVLGAVLFGLGWGLAGFCPGPVLCLFTQFTLQISVVWLICFALGQIIANLIIETVFTKSE